MGNRKTGIFRLLEIAGEKPALLLAAGIFSAFSAVCLLLPYLAVYLLLAGLLAGGANAVPDGGGMMHWGLVALAGLAAGIVLMYFGGLCSHIAAFRMLYRLRLRLAEHIGRLPLGYLTQTSTGIVKKTLEENVEKIEKFIAHQLPDMVSAIVVMLLTLAVMVYLNPLMALACLFPLALGLGLQLGMMISRQARVRVRAYYDALERMNTSTVQYIRGMPAVRIFGQTVHSFRRFYQDIMEYRDLSVRYSDQFQNGFSLFKVVLGSTPAFLLPAGVYLLSGSNGDGTVALEVLFFLIVVPGLAAPVYKLMHFAGTLRDISEGVARIDAVFARRPLPEYPYPERPREFSVQFDEVIFSYEEQSGGRPALDWVSFRAEAGRITALVGPSGAGKSTVANLIPRFWDVAAGTVSIGGVDIRRMRTEDLMSAVSFVFQDTFLFQDTLYANIAAGRPAARPEEVYAAARAAQCYDFIVNLPQGFDTVIGEGGAYLSGGEEQRVAVARAILKDAPILVLDEATAFADAENEFRLQLALNVLLRGKTVIVIAHRLASIREADQILVFRDGRIAERGRHADLLERNGLYAAMWAAGTDEWLLNKGKANADAI
ncbi:ABC transporter ATP-binding protein|uniref:ATP-binding cassette, subfamily B n=1 Tax=Dendrosporobacter quercicolus TaxID=146817 RepID=A0A1G9SX49_9FIRM|nr:ABC transporter ATP-binding protein [Dendrosporobacter quercicolus]NSL48587.1 ABC transporter ATP-binding protein [Dendrosporobacter quercicolus DSM 1736]SDM40038.1 ATP-binding cassette, subfamily B [Dendrosporobacter quercicolus]